MNNRFKIDAFLIFLGFFLICIILAISAAFVSSKKHEKTIQEQNNLEELYKKQTPGFDRLVLTAFDSEMNISGDKVKVIGVDVLNFWLKDSDGKRVIKSITSFNRGVQGSTSSFLIVYTEF